MLEALIERNQPASLRIDRETFVLPLASRSMSVDDLNHLLKCEQLELLKEQHAVCAASRSAHRLVALAYGRRIREHHHPYRSGAVGSRSAFAPYPFGSEGRQS